MTAPDDPKGGDSAPPPAPEQRELAYYRRQVDALAGENLKVEYVISGLRHELTQKRQGFALLSQLQDAIGAHKHISSIFSVALPSIGATLGMDRAVVLSPGRSENLFRPTQWVGFRQEAAARFETLELELPAALATGAERLLVNKTTPKTPVIETLQAAFELPYLLAVPVLVDSRPIALLLSGRLRESKPIYPPLDDGDLDTFVAIAGLISASVRNMRVGVLEEMDRLKTQFFANISHEFRTPITLTLGPVEQLLSGRYGSLGGEVQEQLTIVRRNQQRLLTLVNQILDLAKLEAGEMRLQASRTPGVNRLIAELASQFQSAAEERGLELKLDLSPAAEGAELYLDREKFERLLFNLLSNALKFTRRGHIELSTDIRDGAFRLTISDTGVGIKEDQLPHIFDRFRQADGSESREFAGTGIGLSLVKEIASLHGGDVTVHSRYGAGTAFRLTLPLGSSHLDPAFVVEGSLAESSALMVSRELAFADEGRTDTDGVDRSNSDAETAFDGDRPTVLYAEDNPDLRRHVRGILAGSYNVFLACDGRDALEKMRLYRPDLVLSDQMMPHMSGRELLCAIREDEALRSTPVVFLTAKAGSEARIESLQAGADDYLAKPFNEGELLARVRNLLKARAQEKSLAELNERLSARVEEQLAELLRGGELQRFIPRSVAERVLRGDLGDAESFERRRITILCGNLVGFAELTEQLEPEDLALAMSEFLRETSAVVMAHSGTADRLTPDALVVLFGAPQELAPEDQAWAASETAFEIRRKVRELAAGWRRRGIAGTLDIRAGINTGYCTVGVFGGEALRSYTAVGTTLTLARALEGDAPSGTILCAASTRALLGERVKATPRGARELAGIARPAESFELWEQPAPGQRGLPRLRDFAFMPR